ncbi:hypothetical protein LBMAG42_50080 [Deltaproteobacteria bacterium]|nr:hypothetical protein LBMAG42_50080 [Deltaproteobacteria bacterium]
MSDVDTALAGAEPAPSPVTSRNDYKSDRMFADFPISPTALQALADMGYTHATPVQSTTIEPALAGRDLIVRAKTGTGKTTAFGLPMIERVEEGARITQALVLTPTRELAVQVAQEIAQLAKYRDVRITAIYGGVGFPPQEEALRDGSEIVVGTPGRLLDHIRRGNLKLDQVKVVVLDEADEMLSMGFFEDVRKIVERTNPERQTMLFSATLDESLKGFARNYMKSPEDIHLSADGDNVHLIEHFLYETSPDYHKARALLDLIELERPTSAIIFCNTREDVSTVYTYLDRQGLSVEMLSGELAQNKRERVMARIKAGGVQFLVSTDVAARGIDISDLSHVIHYALPDDAAIYLHRSGRTGRIGKEGTVLVLAGGMDFSTRLTLERKHKIKFEVKLLPTAEESAQLRTERFARLLKEASGTMPYESYLDAVRAIKQRPDADTLIAVALKAFLDWDRRRKLMAADASLDGGGESGGDDSRDGERTARSDRQDRGGPPDRNVRPERPRDGDRGGDRGPRSAGGGRDDRGGRGGRDDRGGRGDRPREDRPREDRGPRPALAEGGASPAVAGGERRERTERGPRPERAPRVEAAPVAAKPATSTEGPELDEPDDGPEEGGVEGAVGADGVAKKRRRRRRRRGGAAGGEAGVEATEGPASAGQDGGEVGGGD